MRFDLCVFDLGRYLHHVAAPALLSRIVPLGTAETIYMKINDFRTPFVQRGIGSDVGSRFRMKQRVFQCETVET
jgi:hypothetical protein